MGSLINSITSPFGVKPFKGGPYPDAGLMDKQQQALSGPLPQISDLGALGALPQVYGQIAKMTGVPDFLGNMPSPVAPGTPAQGTANQPGAIAQNAMNMDKQANLANQIAQFDPNKFTSSNQQLFNNMASQNAVDKNTALANIRARLSARGLGDSTSMAAAEAYLQQKYGGNIRNQELGLLQGQQAQQQNALGQQANALGSIYNAQNQRMLQQAGILGQQAQLARENTANSMGQIGNLAAIFTGGRPLGQVFGGGSGPDATEKQNVPLGSDYGLGTGPIMNPYQGVDWGNVNWGLYG